MRNDIINFGTGTIGTGLTYEQVQQSAEQIATATDETQLKASIISVIGGLISTIVVNLLNRWLNRKNQGQPTIKE